MLSTSELEELFEHSFKGIREGLPYFNVVRFNDGLYQICRGVCNAIWSEHPRNIFGIRKSLKNEIRALQSYNPSHEVEINAREILLGEFKAIYSVFERTRKKMNKITPNFRIPMRTDNIYQSVQNFIINMILSRDTKGFDQINKRLDNMVSKAYRDKNVNFKELCFYSNALLLFRSAVYLSDQ